MSTFFNFMGEAKVHISETINDISMRLLILDQFIEKAFDGVIMVDKSCKVTFVNKSAAEIIDLPEKEILGKHINEVVPFSRLSVTVETGKPEIGWLQKVGNREGIVHRIPIIVDGKIIGALGIVVFRDINVVKKILDNLKINYNDSLSSEKEDKFRRIGSKYTFDNFIGESQEITKLITKAKKIARTSYPVLIIGETGTGKEILAHAIHSENTDTYMSPFIKINCTAIPGELLESELFGYEKGAFTGAEKSGKMGKFELAGTGTILLDEIGDMDLRLQGKLLRVIEEKEFERVGGLKLIPLRARIIATTNKNLKELCSQGKFRQDLYYRLSVFEIEIPPLRERREDVMALIKYCKDLIGLPEFSPEAVNALLNYDWPGNVRELKSILNRIHTLEDVQDVVKLEHLPKYIINKYHEEELNNRSCPVENKMAEHDLGNDDRERNDILRALAAAGYNKSKAAKLLKISRATLYNRIKKLNLINKVNFKIEQE